MTDLEDERERRKITTPNISKIFFKLYSQFRKLYLKTIKSFCHNGCYQLNKKFKLHSQMIFFLVASFLLIDCDSFKNNKKSLQCAIPVLRFHVGHTNDFLDGGGYL